MNENKRIAIKFKFIEGVEEYGIQYDWNKIRKCTGAVVGTYCR